MKRLISVILICIILLSSNCFEITVSAKGKIIGKAICSDVCAFVDGELIPSYNINGYTAIVAEDLSEYGFDVEWDESARALNITYNKAKRYWPINENDERFDFGEIIGTKLFDIYKTDIKVYLDGDVIDAFNINGRTAIYIDNLDRYGKIIWDEEERNIMVRRLDKNYPYKLTENDKNEAKQIGKGLLDKDKNYEFWNKYMLTNITNSRNIKLVDFAFFLTPFSILCMRYAYAASNGSENLDYDVEEWLDILTSSQSLRFDVHLVGDTEDFHQYIKFGLMQGHTYIQCTKLDEDTPAVKDSKIGKYRKYMTIYFSPLNAIDFTKPANFIATPQRGASRGETIIEVDFSKFR